MVDVARLVLACVLAFGGFAKLADRTSGSKALVAFGIPDRAAAAAGWILIGSELAVAAGLLVDSSVAAGAIGALALLGLVSVAVAASLIGGRTPVCNCFGRFSRGPISWSTLARNGLLASLAAYIAVGGREPELFAGLALLSGAAWFALGSSRLRARRGLVAPSFSLRDAAGEMWTLRTLLASGRPALLVFGQPACGACQAMGADLLDWHARLSDQLVVAVVEHAPGVERAGYPVLADPDGAAALAYGVAATPSAVLIESNGRIGSALARGAAEIEELVTARFEHDRFARRALIVRAARGVTTLGALPLLAAACGTSSSSSSMTASTSASTATSATGPKGLKVGSAYICQQKYALCTNAPCRPDPHNPNVVICDCVVEDGYSVGLASCPQRAPRGTTLYSTFSTTLVTGNIRAMTCGAHVPWANCVDAPCEIDPNNPTKATCQCPLVKIGPSFTFGGDCNASTCGKTVWSGAHTNLGGPQVAAAMKRLGQPLATPQPCPKA